MKGFQLRERLDSLLGGHGAHISFTEAVAGFPVSRAGERIDNLAHTAWQLLYHTQLVQWDIVDFVRNQRHDSPSYPGGFWPEADGPPDEAAWHETVRRFEADLKWMRSVIADPEQDLFEPFPHGSGHNLFHEALTLADHNSYHIGQFVDLRMLLGVPVRDW
ncbi:MAG: DinB family protein [Spirochaetaceae bacterium]